MHIDAANLALNLLSLSTLTTSWEHLTTHAKGSHVQAQTANIDGPQSNHTTVDLVVHKLRTSKVD